VTGTKSSLEKAKTSRTKEGAEKASEWLERNSSVLPQLRHVLIEYYLQSGRDFPWRRTTDPYAILIAEVLLQKTGSRPVGDIWRSFLQRYPTVDALASASIEDLEAVLRPLGLRKRAKILYDAAQVLMRDAKGKVPGDATFLRSIYGIGSYTTAAVLSFGHNISAATIDVNAARVYTRIAGFVPNTLRQGLAFATIVGEEVITPETHRAVNLGLLDFAAQICKTRPLCERCPAVSICKYGRIRTSGQEA
jgi:A/G-specific adenine glycosylase